MYVRTTIRPLLISFFFSSFFRCGPHGSGETLSFNSLRCENPQAGYDVVTLDSSTDRHSTRAMLAAAHRPSMGVPSTWTRKTPVSLQGNFDVGLLRADQSHVGKVTNAVTEMLRDLGPQRLIANLGEGLMGKEDPTLVEAFVQAVHTMSAELIAEQGGG